MGGQQDLTPEVVVCPFLSLLKLCCEDRRISIFLRNSPCTEACGRAVDWWDRVTYEVAEQGRAAVSYGGGSHPANPADLTPPSPPQQHQEH